MKMTRLWVSALAAAVLLVGTSRTSLADDPKPSVVSFGALHSVDAERVQGQAKAWLQEIGKKDAATMQKFEAIWKEDGRTVLDRLTATFALGSPDAAKALAQAGNIYLPAPTGLPAVMTDKKASAFFKSNFALAYARLLSQRFVYEQALEALRTTKAEDVADPAAYLFHRAICEYTLVSTGTALQVDVTSKGVQTTLDRLLGDVIDIPERYKTVSVLMLLDMETWKSKDLGAVARMMDNSKRRLDLARGGPKTQKLQKEIVRRLDELIKELENQQKQKDGEGKGGKPGGS